MGKGSVTAELVARVAGNCAADQEETSSPAVQTSRLHIALASAGSPFHTPLPCTRTHNNKAVDQYLISTPCAHILQWRSCLGSWVAGIGIVACLGSAGISFNVV